jgi:hypothetical protein
MQRYTVYFFGNCSTCFGWYPHPSSGAKTTVSTASGICHTVTGVYRYRGRVGTGLSVLCCVVLYCRWRTCPTTQDSTLSTSYNSSAIAADSSNSVTTTRCCRYSCMLSWWWVGVPIKTRRAVSRKINCVTLHLVGCTLQCVGRSSSRRRMIDGHKD